MDFIIGFILGMIVAIGLMLWFISYLSKYDAIDQAIKESE